MNDRDSVIECIDDLLGNTGSRRLAERVFEQLHSDGDIAYHDHEGFVLPDDINLIFAAGELLEDQ